MIAFFQRRALSREIVDHREDAETAAIGERIRRYADEPLARVRGFAVENADFEIF